MNYSTLGDLYFFMWLKMATTNRDPAVILGYYLECVSDVKVCPRVIRIDKGTENSLVSECQMALRLHHPDSVSGQKSVGIGSSPTNSRIESFWSRLRRMKLDWWIIRLKELQQNGYFDPTSASDRQCLVVTLERLMQREISDFSQYWNSHSIRMNSTAECPSGIPQDMYDMPSHLGESGEEYGCEVNADLWLHYFINVKKLFYDPHFYTMCNELCNARYGIDLNNGVTHTNWLDLYKFIRNNVLYT